MVRQVLRSTSDPTDELDLIEVDPNWSLDRFMKSSTFGIGLRQGSFGIHKLQKNSPKFDKIERDRIRAMKFEKERIHFLSDAFVSASLQLPVGILRSEEGEGRENIA